MSAAARNSLTPGIHYGQIWVHKAPNVRVENNIAVAGEGALINQAFNLRTAVALMA